MSSAVEVTVVTESFNLAEGAAIASLRRTLACASEAAGLSRDGAARGAAAEVLLADVDGRPEIDAIMLEFPHARRIDCRGLGYDVAKNRAIEAARGQYVAFLDGDCVPDAGWLAHLLEPMRRDGAFATCGYTRYAGGFWAAVQSVMDFGFLFPLQRRPVACYGSNNWAARRADLLARPIPEEEALRCSCYPHAQAMANRGTPFELAPDARVVHDMPAFWAERLRRGYDIVAACWSGTAPREARLLRYGLLAAPLFYLDNVRLDWMRMVRSRRDVGISWLQLPVALCLMPVLRLIDLIGIVRALNEPRACVIAPP